MNIEKAINYLKIKNAVTQKQIDNGELFLYVDEEKKEIEAIENVLAELETTKLQKENLLEEYNKRVCEIIDLENKLEESISKDKIREKDRRDI